MDYDSDTTEKNKYYGIYKTKESWMKTLSFHWVYGLAMYQSVMNVTGIN